MREFDSDYLKMPTSIRARPVLEAVSFIRAAYIRHALSELDKGHYDRVEKKLEDAMDRMQQLIDEIEDVMEQQSKLTS